MNPAGEMYACLYAKEFPTQAVLRLRPELRERPVVVIEGEPPLETVCSFNAKARYLGIVRGMTRVELDTFSSLIVFPRSHTEEVSTHAVTPKWNDYRTLSMTQTTCLHVLTRSVSRCKRWLMLRHRRWNAGSWPLRRCWRAAMSGSSFRWTCFSNRRDQFTRGSRYESRRSLGRDHVPLLNGRQ